MTVDPRVAFLADADPATRRRFLDAAIARLAYDRRDPEPCDLSIVPRVVTRAGGAAIAEAARRVVEASLAWALDTHASARPVPGYSLDWVRGEVVRPPAELVGDVRLDFLVAGGRLRLLEAGWVNLSAFDYAPQAALALLDAVPALATDFHVERPVMAMRRRLLERGVRRLAILVKEEHTVYAANDFALIAEALAPIETLVVAEPAYALLAPAGRGLRLGDVPLDAVYLRALDGPDAFAGRHAASNRATLRLLLGSDVLLHDHPLMLLAEDKDLGFLVERDPALADIVPATARPAEIDPTDAARWVLKLRDRHSGSGVFLDEEAMRARWHDPAAILQERIVPDPLPVTTVHGHRGAAVADLAVHVSYRYDVAARRCLVAEVAGYFSRFSLTGGIVNLCAGGGIVPVLSERPVPSVG
jgi:hypothetical protein